MAIVGNWRHKIVPKEKKINEIELKQTPHRTTIKPAEDQGVPEVKLKHVKKSEPSEEKEILVERAGSAEEKSFTEKVKNIISSFSGGDIIVS